MTDYFELPEMPGRQMFRCDKRQATLQVSSCAGMWSVANDRNAPERLDQCRNCSLGAKHAGVGEISLCPLRGSSICARCHQGTTRLIRKHLCVSCANREYEYRKGRNARGTAPVTHPPLAPIEIRFLAGDQVSRSAIDAVSMTELVVAALRDSSKQVTFGFFANGPKVPQQDLFGGSA